MEKLILKLPVAIGKQVWDIDWLDRPALVTGYRIGRMMGEDEEEYEDRYNDEELYIQYTTGSADHSVPVSELGEVFFLTKDEAVLKRSLELV